MNTRKIEVGALSELPSGQMKEVSADGETILLARVGDKCFAVGATCPHYGAPLVEGALNGDRLVCPWHHACFDVRTGKLEEPPALDSLPNFPVTVEAGRIIVELPEEVHDREMPRMVKRDPGDERVFVILGGGAAGYMAAQTLREDGFGGRILIVTREGRSPYDRPNLSKDYLQGNAEPEWIPLRPDEFFAEHEIEILVDKTAASVDVDARTIEFDDGETLHCDSLLIATGGIPRQLPFQIDQPRENVFLLRSFADSDAIAEAAGSDARIVVIGASFVGMEAASSLRMRGCDVTVVSPDTVPFEKTLGPEIGVMLKNVHEQHGVKFRLGTKVEGLTGDGKADAVLLNGGERLEADLVVVGIGVSPATGLIKGVELHKDGGVMVDKHLRIANGVYAAGDIVHFPDPRTGETPRIEHWRVALQQGRTAAHNMAGKPTAFAGVPFFWTAHFGASLDYVGHAEKWDRIVFDGEVDKQEFLAFYVQGGRVLAVAGMNRNRDLAIWEELFRLNRVPSADTLTGKLPDPAALLADGTAHLPAASGT